MSIDTIFGPLSGTALWVIAIFTIIYISGLLFCLFNILLEQVKENIAKKVDRNDIAIAFADALGCGALPSKSKAVRLLMTAGVHFDWIRAVESEDINCVYRFYDKSDDWKMLLLKEHQDNTSLHINDFVTEIVSYGNSGMQKKYSVYLLNPQNNNPRLEQNIGFRAVVNGVSTVFYPESRIEAFRFGILRRNILRDEKKAAKKKQNTEAEEMSQRALSAKKARQYKVACQSLASCDALHAFLSGEINESSDKVQDAAATLQSITERISPQSLGTTVEEANHTH